MSKFLKSALLVGTVAIALTGTARAAGDAEAGKKVFNKCRACHAVGEGAANKVGPQLNNVVGRSPAGVADYSYSPAMKAFGEGGAVWDEATLAQYLADPKALVKGTKMAFPGLKKPAEVDDVIAYLATFKQDSASLRNVPILPRDMELDYQALVHYVSDTRPATGAANTTTPAPSASETASVSTAEDSSLAGLGRPATPEEVAAWDIDVRPDGKGLPVGRGTVAAGETLFSEQCASCHGDFGEGIGRWPVLAGGRDTLTRDRPEKTVGSYWPYLSTVYDYVNRAMPFGNARSLSHDDVYALTAYILYLNDIVTEEDFELSNENFTSVAMPNAAEFVPDDRDQEAHYKADAEPCMRDCKPAPAEITMRAQVLDVTPEDSGEGEGDGPAGGNVD